MKKIVILFMLLSIVCLTGCKGGNDNNSVKNKGQQVSEKTNLTEAQKRVVNEALEVSRKYFEIDAVTESSGNFYVLELLGIEYDRAIEEKSFDKIDTLVDTGVKYDDFKTELLKYMTEEFFNEKYGNREDYANINDNLHIKYSYGVEASNEVTSVDLISENGNVYEFDVQYIEEAGTRFKISTKMKMIMTDDGLKISGQEGYTVIEEYVWDSGKHDFVTMKEREELTAERKKILSKNKWQCYKVMDTRGNEKDYKAAFGTDTVTNLGSLEFSQDGTFVHIMPGATGSEVKNKGTYTFNGSTMQLKHEDGKIVSGNLLMKDSDTEILLYDYQADNSFYFKIK